MTVAETAHPGRWWHAIDGGRIQCDLCPRDCQLHEGRGACFVRKMQHGTMVLTTYMAALRGSASILSRRNPQPLLPCSAILSGTADAPGLPLLPELGHFKSRRDMDRLWIRPRWPPSPPPPAATAPLPWAYTYNDPVVFAEYAIDTAAACRAAASNVAVTAGYIHAAPAANSSPLWTPPTWTLKAFTDEFTRSSASPWLTPVLDTPPTSTHETEVLAREITTLLIPGQRRRWRNRPPRRLGGPRLGPDVPCTSPPSTPTGSFPTCRRRPGNPGPGRRIALDAGLHHVYTGNVHDREGGTTFCPGCRAASSSATGMTSAATTSTRRARCPHCGSAVAGRFRPTAGQRQRPLARGGIACRLAA